MIAIAPLDLKEHVEVLSLDWNLLELPAQVQLQLEQVEFEDDDSEFTEMERWFGSLLYDV